MSKQDKAVAWQMVPVEPTDDMLKQADRIIGPDPRFMRMTWTAMLAAAPAPPAHELRALPEPTEAMIDAYLKANDAYWRETDALETPPHKWRTGTVRDATKASLAAAIAADRAGSKP